MVNDGAPQMAEPVGHLDNIPAMDESTGNDLEMQETHIRKFWKLQMRPAEDDLPQ